MKMNASAVRRMQHSPDSASDCSARSDRSGGPLRPGWYREWPGCRSMASRRIARNSVASDYMAHLGANSGGANGVYWVEVLGEADGGVLIRNLAGRGKHSIETVEAGDRARSALSAAAMGRRRALLGRAAAHLCWRRTRPRERASTSGDAERYPRTLAYLERFRELLHRRAAYRRYQQSGPFYAMYNVGPYTVAPIKVVWRRMDRRINAAVVEFCGAGVSPACSSAGTYWDGSCAATRTATAQLFSTRFPGRRDACTTMPAADSARDVRAGGVRIERRGPLPVCDTQQCGGQRTGGCPQRSRRQGFWHARHVRLPPPSLLSARR